MAMWTIVLVALAFSHAGDGFVTFGFNVPPAPEYGSTVTLEVDYRLGRGEYIKKMKWYKDDVLFMSYSERPEKFMEWTPLPGVNIDESVSTASKVVITDVGDEASGQYTLEMQVFGPGGNVGNIVNGQFMSVGGADTLGTRFGGGLGGQGGGTFFQSSNVGGVFPGNTFQSSTGGTSFQSAGGVGPDTLGTRTSFQSSSAGGNTAIQGTGPGVSFQSSSAGGNTAIQGTAPGVSFQSAGGAFQGIGPGGPFQSAGGAFQGVAPGGAFQSATAGSGVNSFQGVVSGTDVGPLGVRTSFQSASTGGAVGAQALEAALAQTQAQVQNAVNQINQLQAALANIGI